MKLQNLGFFPHLTFADKPEINFPILTNLSKLAPKEVADTKTRGRQGYFK